MAKKVETEFKYKLDRPIIIDGVETAQLTIRYPKVRDIRKTHGMEYKADIYGSLLQSCADLSPEQVEELGVTDFNKIVEKIDDFI